jgi:hypothetical protein
MIALMIIQIFLTSVMVAMDVAKYIRNKDR